MNIYLAGTIFPTAPFDPAVSANRRCLTRLLSALGHTVITPLRGREIMSNGAIRPLPARTYVTRDRRDVARADMVLAHFPRRPTPGTCVELGWADALRIPIVLIRPDEEASPFLDELAVFATSSLTAAVDFVKRWS